MCRALDQQARLQYFMEFLQWHQSCKKEGSLREGLQGLTASEQEMTIEFLRVADKKKERKKKVQAVENDFSAIQRLANAPPLHRKKLTTLAQQYNLPDLLPSLQFFLTIVKLTGNMQALPYAAHSYSHMYPGDLQLLPLKVMHANAWLSFQLLAPTIQDEDLMAPPVTVQALPPSTEYPFGRLNTVLIHNNDTAMNIAHF
jgi:hypothetical protein